MELLKRNDSPDNKRVAAKRLPFHWRYIALPLAIFLLSVILSAYFYPKLPATRVATHFGLDGIPDRWLTREMALVWVLLPQLVLTLLAGAIILGVGKFFNRAGQAGNLWIKPEKILIFMGNIVALPQLVVGFTMLDIFSYNSYQTHIMPRWLSLVIIMVLATAALGLFLAFVISKTRQQFPNQKRKE